MVQLEHQRYFNLSSSHHFCCRFFLLFLSSQVTRHYSLRKMTPLHLFMFSKITHCPLHSSYLILDRWKKTLISGRQDICMGNRCSRYLHIPLVFSGGDMRVGYLLDAQKHYQGTQGLKEPAGWTRTSLLTQTSWVSPKSHMKCPCSLAAGPLGHHAGVWTCHDCIRQQKQMGPWLCSSLWVALCWFIWGQRRGVSRGICEWKQEGAVGGGREVALAWQVAAPGHLLQPSQE